MYKVVQTKLSVKLIYSYGKYINQLSEITRYHCGTKLEKGPLYRQ